jgi:hypothetical protein
MVHPAIAKDSIEVTHDSAVDTAYSHGSCEGCRGALQIFMNGMHECSRTYAASELFTYKYPFPFLFLFLLEKLGLPTFCRNVQLKKAKA